MTPCCMTGAVKLCCMAGAISRRIDRMECARFPLIASHALFLSRIFSDLGGLFIFFPPFFFSVDDEGCN